jgi:hypothetical protein
MASCPEILMMAIAPAPDGVASATMASLFSIFFSVLIAKVLKQSSDEKEVDCCWDRVRGRS